MLRRLLLLALTTTPALAETDGLALWGRIHEVLSHARCANCHVGESNEPIWSGASYGAQPRPHGMNINAGASRRGAESVPCNACHTGQNSPTPHGPPGAEVWHLPPVSMQWFGKPSAEICAQIKDETRNGNRTLEAVAGHIEHDKLVAWGWDPGPGRQPAPYSLQELAGFIRAWDRQGAPCPAQ